MTRTFYQRMSLFTVLVAVLLLAGGCPPSPDGADGDGGSTDGGVTDDNGGATDDGVTTDDDDTADQDDSTGDETQAALRRFESGDELLSFFKEQAIARAVGDDWSGEWGEEGDGWETEDLGEGVTDSGGVPVWGLGDGGGSYGAQAGEPGEYSTTNIQEAGVDESDVMKSDGTYFYIAKGRTLRIVQAVPVEQMHEVGRVDFDVDIDALYLLDSTVLVLGWDYEWLSWFQEQVSTLVAEVDVTDPSAPTVTAQNELDGALVSSRLVNGRLILPLSFTAPLPDDLNEASVEQMSLDEILPKMRTSGGEAVLVQAEDWFHPVVPDGYMATAVVTLDADDIETVLGSVAVMADAGTVYASTEALYLTDDEYDAENGYRASTAVHKLAFDEEGVAEYVGSGSVPGRLLNQFSLGEHDGYLRVATHVGGSDLFIGEEFDIVFADAPVRAVATAADKPAGREQPADSEDDEEESEEGDSAPSDAPQTPSATQAEPYNAVFVLGESADRLVVVGSLENIAPGEQLYAARFVGERGFLVTFEQIDPLFVLDLSVPEEPVLLGELEVPGYSDYLHPFGENLLIGVGRSTLELEWEEAVPAGVQLSLFDVSDWSKPTLIDQLAMGGYGSVSDVSYTHKAFTFLPDAGLLAIPVQLWSEQEDSDEEWFWGGEVEFDGVVCFSVDGTTGFTEVDRVGSVIYQEFGWTEWRRAALIDDVLYALTPAGVRGRPLDDSGAPAMLVLIPSIVGE